MSTSFVAALSGTVLAAVGTGLAIRLCVRKPRTDMVAWVIALAGLTVALAAQAAGYRRGFVPATFRATQLGAALVAPLALAWGMAEVAAKGLVARFAARLLLAALFVVAGVILATDVLSAQPFSQQWPAARDHFEFLPRGLLDLVAVAVAATVLLALAATALRSRRDAAWRAALIAVALASVAALATQGLQAALPANTAYPAFTLIAAVAAWLAAGRAARVSMSRIRTGAGGPAGRQPRVMTPATAVRTRSTCTAMVTGISRTAGPSLLTSTAGTARAGAPRARPTGPRRVSTAASTRRAGTGRASSRRASSRRASPPEGQYPEGQYAGTGGFPADRYPGTGSFRPAGGRLSRRARRPAGPIGRPGRSAGRAGHRGVRPAVPAERVHGLRA